VTVDGLIPQHLRAVSSKLAEAGLEVDEGAHHVRVSSRAPLSAVDIRTYRHPGFPTDLQAPFAALLTQASGESLIHESMYEDRLRYASQLVRMGADIEVHGRTAVVRGPTPLRGERVTALDIRAGVAVLLAALVADGQSAIERADLIERGHERLHETLTRLGARVQARHSD
jgi:UDP-N-acetylglucosamine 1-carboxyvinyltransferase